MEYNFWILFIFAIKSWETVSITNRNKQSTPVRNLRHIGTSSALADWEIGLRESANQALLRERYADPNLRHHLLAAPLVGKQNTASPFGDVAVLARGQLYATYTGYIFVQDPYQNDCDDCHNIRPQCGTTNCAVWKPHGHEQLIALWTVKRLRHRDNNSIRYEIEYTISPITAAIRPGFVTQNGRFNYNVPGHIFVIKSDNTNAINHFANKDIHDKPAGGIYPTIAYEPPHYNRDGPNHFRPGILIGVSPDGYKHVLHSFPAFFTSYPAHPQTQSTIDPKEADLYKNLLESLASKTTTQKEPHRFSLNVGEKPTKPAGTTSIFTKPTTYPPETQTTFVPAPQTTLVQLTTGQIVPLTELTPIPTTTHRQPDTFAPIPFPQVQTTTHKVPETATYTFVPVTMTYETKSPPGKPTQPTPFLTGEGEDEFDEGEFDIFYEKNPPTKPTVDKQTPMTTLHFYAPASEEVVPTKKLQETTKVTSSTTKKKPTKFTISLDSGASDDYDEEDFNLFPELPTVPMTPATQKPPKKPYPSSINEQLPAPDQNVDTTVPYISTTERTVFQKPQESTKSEVHITDLTEQTKPFETSSAKIISTQTTTVSSTPRKTTSVGTTPRKTTSVGTTPVKTTTTVGTTSQKTTPSITTPKKTTTIGTTSRKTTPVSTTVRKTTKTVGTTSLKTTTNIRTTPRTTTSVSTTPRTTTSASTTPKTTTSASTTPKTTTSASTTPKTTTTVSTTPKTTTTVSSTTPRTTTSVSTTPRTTTSVSTTPKTTTTVRTTPKTTTTVRTTPKTTTTVSTTPKTTTTVSTTPKTTTTVSTTPKTTTTVSTTPKTTTTVGTTSQKITTVGTTPQKITTVGTTSQKTTPVGTTPVKTTPVVVTTPVKTTIVSTTPVKTTTTVGTTSQKTTPVKTTTTVGTTSQKTTPVSTEPAKTTTTVDTTPEKTTTTLKKTTTVGTTSMKTTPISTTTKITTPEGTTIITTQVPTTKFVQSSTETRNPETRPTIMGTTYHLATDQATEFEIKSTTAMKVPQIETTQQQSGTIQSETTGTAVPPTKTSVYFDDTSKPPTETTTLKQSPTEPTTSTTYNQPQTESTMSTMYIQQSTIPQIETISTTKPNEIPTSAATSENTPQYILTHINADGTVTMTSTPITTYPTTTRVTNVPADTTMLAKTTEKPDFLESPEGSNIGSGSYYNKYDYNEDDIFGNTKSSSTETTTEHPASKATQSEVADQLFGNKRSAKLIKFQPGDPTPNWREPKIIYSNFYEASTLTPTTPMTPRAKPTRYFYPMTSQSYSTSISFEVNSKNRPRTTPSYPKQQYELGDAGNVNRINRGEWPTPTEQMTIDQTEETNKVFDRVALQLVNHARRIDLLSQRRRTTTVEPSGVAPYTPRRRKYMPRRKVPRKSNGRSRKP